MEECATTTLHKDEKIQFIMSVCNTTKHETCGHYMGLVEHFKIMSLETRTNEKKRMTNFVKERRPQQKQDVRDVKEQSVLTNEVGAVILKTLFMLDTDGVDALDLAMAFNTLHDVDKIIFYDFQEFKDRDFKHVPDELATDLADIKHMGLVEIIDTHVKITEFGVRKSHRYMLTDEVKDVPKKFVQYLNDLYYLEEQQAVDDFLKNSTIE